MFQFTLYQKKITVFFFEINKKESKKSKIAKIDFKSIHIIKNGILKWKK